MTPGQSTRAILFLVFHTYLPFATAQISSGVCATSNHCMSSQTPALLPIPSNSSSISLLETGLASISVSSSNGSLSNANITSSKTSTPSSVISAGTTLSQNSTLSVTNSISLGATQVTIDSSTIFASTLSTSDPILDSSIQSVKTTSSQSFAFSTTDSVSLNATQSSVGSSVISASTLSTSGPILDSSTQSAQTTSSQNTTSGITHSVSLNISQSLVYSSTISTTTSSTTGSILTSSIAHLSSSADAIIPSSSTTGPASTTSDLTLPPGITLPPNPTTILDLPGTEIQSSASELSMVMVGWFPLLQDYIDNPQPPQIAVVTGALDNILPKASDLLGKLPMPTDGAEPCNSKGMRSLHKRTFLDGLFKTAFSLVTCVIDNTNKVKEGIVGGTKDAVRALSNDLKPMVDALSHVDPKDEPEPSISASERQGSSQSESSSSSSCTLKTASDCTIACTATAITTVGGSKRGIESEACTTRCGSPVTNCDATGATTVSTITSTSSVVQRCSPDCEGCYNDGPLPPPESENLDGYLTATNGVLYLPAQTVTELPTEAVIEARDNTPKVTGTATRSIVNRALPKPINTNRAAAGLWIRNQLRRSRNKLEHGNYPNGPSTGFTFELRDFPDTWVLGNLYGCTSVVVVSRKRILMTHFFESPSMISLDDQVLNREVLNPLRNGGDYGLQAHAIAGGDFENIPENHVRAFIFTPYARNFVNPRPTEYESPAAVARIKELLKTVLGSATVATVIPYRAGLADPDNRHPRGKLVIQYDPLEYTYLDTRDNCIYPVPQLEIWFEDNPSPRYTDSWHPFDDQIVPIVVGSAGTTRGEPANHGSRRLLVRGLNVTDRDEEWENSTTLVRRQSGGVCLLPSASQSVSSNQLSLSTASIKTTFGTSIVSFSSVGRTDSSGATPSPSTTETVPPESSSVSTSPTEKPPPEASGLPSQSPTPTPKALTIMFRQMRINQDSPDAYHNVWAFFETEKGKPADGCADPIFQEDSISQDKHAVKTPPWPQGTYTMKMYGEEGCQYWSKGADPGVLHCPSFADNITCHEEEEKSSIEMVRMCLTSSYVLRWTFHRVAYCEW